MDELRISGSLITETVLGITVLHFKDSRGRPWDARPALAHEGQAPSCTGFILA
jgi:hypothetical protein